MTKPTKHSLFKSFSFAIHGISHVFKHERNFRIHTLSVILVLILAFLFKCDFIELSLLIIVMGMVLVAEMINSAIEYTWDKLEPNHHPVVGIIKDTMSGSVLIASLVAFFVGLLIVLRHII